MSSEFHALYKTLNLKIKNVFGKCLRILVAENLNHS